MRRFALILMLASLALPAAAAVTGGSNIALSDYPAPNCSKPGAISVPGDPPASSDKKTVDAYNAKVKAFNAQVTVYNAAIAGFNACMKTYVENGNNDMLRIKQAIDAAVAAANVQP